MFKRRSVVPTHPPTAEFTLFLSQEEVETHARDGDDLTYDGFRVFIDVERNNEISRDDESLSMPGVFFSRVASPNEHTRELAQPSIDIGAVLILRPEPSNRFDKNAIENRQPSDRWSDRLRTRVHRPRARSHSTGS